MKKSVFRLMSILVLLLLLTHPALSLAGARDGLVLWSKTVLPTLLPFMICSNLIVSLDGIHLLTAPFRPFLRHFFRLSDAGSYVFMSGLLCGYPMGAKTCSEFADQKRITQDEGKYLLSICNHPSPMFILGFVASVMDSRLPVALICLSLYLPILPISAFAQHIYGISEICTSASPQTRPERSFDETMMSSFEVMVKIGGYIMIFSILAKFIWQLPFVSRSLQAFLLGIVEITTGIQAVSSAFHGRAQGFVLTLITSFGGLSGIFQTKSVLKNAGLSIRHYVFWKLLHCALSGAVFTVLSSALPAVR